MEYARQFNKLFISPRGAITRMHQDNHHAHAWLSQLRGRKLYVLCPPQDYALVAPRGRSAHQNGTTREGLFDPLDAAVRSERISKGLRVFATVLQPGETLVCPDSWWHYAVALTPSITLMCNFWDRKNRQGLRDMVMRGCAPGPPELPISPSGAKRMTPRPGVGRVVLRQRPAMPSAEQASDVVGVLRQGESAAFDVECCGYVRTAEAPPGSSGRGWAEASALIAA